MHFFHGCECFRSRTKQKLKKSCKGLELTYKTAKRIETDVQNWPPWVAILASLLARANDWELALQIWKLSSLALAGPFVPRHFDYPPCCPSPLKMALGTRLVSELIDSRNCAFETTLHTPGRSIVHENSVA